MTSLHMNPEMAALLYVPPLTPQLTIYVYVFLSTAELEKIDISEQS